MLVPSWDGTTIVLRLLFGTPALAAEVPGGSADVPVAVLSPDDAVRTAIAASPTIRAADAEVRVAEGRMHAASLFLANPEVEGRASFDGETWEVAAGQAVSPTSEGTFVRKEARLARDAAASRRARVELEVAAETRLAYAEAATRVQVARVAQEGLRLAGRLRSAVEAQQAVGEARALDVRLARLQEVHAASALLETRAEEARAMTAVAALLGRTVAASELDPDPARAAPERPVRPESERFDVLAARTAVLQAKARLAAERAAVIPPIAVGVFVEEDAGDRTVGGQLQISLPLFDRNQEARAEALGARSVAEAEVVSQEARVRAEIDSSVARQQEATTILATLGVDLAAEASAALASVEAGYRSGEFDLLETVLLQAEVLDGQAAAAEVRLALAAARIDLLLALEDPALVGGGSP